MQTNIYLYIVLDTHMVLDRFFLRRAAEGLCDGFAMFSLLPSSKRNSIFSAHAHSLCVCVGVFTEYVCVNEVYMNIGFDGYAHQYQLCV